MRCVAAPSDKRYITQASYDDQYRESQMLSDLTFERPHRQRHMQLNRQLRRQRCWGRALLLRIPSRMTVVT